MMKLRWFCLSVVLLVAVALHAEDWRRDFTVGAHPVLRVQTNDASIKVRGDGGNTISVRVAAQGWHVAPGELGVVAQQNGDEVVVRIKVPEHSFHFNLGSGGRSAQAEIIVPQNTVLDIATSDGSLQISGLKGEARLNSSDGSIKIDNFDGTLRAHTSDGSIVAAGRFDLLDLNSSDGSVTVDVWRGSQMAADWNLRTSDGSIRLRLPSDLPASLDAWTSDGHIDLQLPLEMMGRVEKNRVRGNLHGGGHSIQVHTSDGSITLGAL